MVKDRLLTLLQSLTAADRGSVMLWTAVVVAFVAAQPVISVIHEMTVLAAAFLLRWAAASPVLEWPVRSLIADQVYAGVALEAIGNVEGRGLAVGGPIGAALHYVFPNLFLDSRLVVEGAWASAVIASGSSQLSKLLIVASADGLLLFAGVALSQWGLRGRSLVRAMLEPARGNGIVLFGLLLQARGVFAILTAQITQADLEAAGLVHVGTKLLATTQQSYESAVTLLSPMLSMGLRLATLAIVYGLTLLLMRVVLALLRLNRQRQVTLHSSSSFSPTHARNLVRLLPVVIAVFILAALSPTLGLAQTNFGYNDAATDPYAVDGAGRAEEEAEIGVDAPIKATVPSRPSVVSILRQSNGYVYTVDGKEELIRGVGYNVVYRHLTEQERATRYEQDFARMRSVGINTILGWDRDKGYEHDKFDELLLAKAREYGLGVMMPYHLPPEGDYSDEAYQARVWGDVVNWVLRFKDHPAVRMWAIGNEVLHGMPTKSDRRAFARFYLKLADIVHAVDPNHPVIYRDAEEVYLAPLRDALTRSEVKRPWLAYGMNIFTFRIDRVLTEWQSRAPDLPLVVTEFAPNGLSPGDRPRGLVKMWRAIRSHPSNVLGGVVYAWSTAGPEPLDRLFGLVNANGQPVDGSLDAIANEFRNDVEQTTKEHRPVTSAL